MRPLVSIGIPTYNGAEFLTECLESISGQTFKDFEVNVVDDCSTDETLAIARAYVAKDARITVEANAARVGLAGNFNRCLARARGRYFCIFGQDDIMLPGNLARKFDIMESTPGAAFIHSNVYRILEMGRVFDEHWYPASRSDCVRQGTELLASLFTGQNEICCPSVLARKDCLDRAGGFDERLFFTCDWEMWMRLCAEGNVACIGEPLVKFRRHPATESRRIGGTWQELQQELFAKRIAWSRYGSRLGKPLRKKAWNNLAARALQLARSAFYADDFDNFRRCLVFAIRLRPKLLLDTEAMNLVGRAVVGRRFVSAYRSLMRTIDR